MNAAGIKSRMKQIAAERGMNLATACRGAGLGAHFAYNLESPSVIKLEAFARFCRCDIVWLLYGDEGVPGEREPEDGELRRLEIPLDVDTGSNIHLGIEAWQEWDKKSFPPLLHALQRLALYDKAMLFKRRRGKFMLQYVGGWLCNSLGDYVFRAPGHYLGDMDRDKRFATWCGDAYVQAMDLKAPLREACDTPTTESGTLRRFNYDRVLLPSRSQLLVLIQPMPFAEFDKPGACPSRQDTSPTRPTKPYPQSAQSPPCG